MPPTMFDQILKDTCQNIFALNPNVFAYVLRVNRQLSTDTPNILFSRVVMTTLAPATHKALRVAGAKDHPHAEGMWVTKTSTHW